MRTGSTVKLSKSDVAQLNKAKIVFKRAKNANFALRGFREARRFLKPLVDKSIPETRYLAATFGLADEFESNAAFDQWRFGLIHKAAEGGYAAAQFVLGQAYSGRGAIGHDDEKSAYWFSLSAEQGISSRLMGAGT